MGMGYYGFLGPDADEFHSLLPSPWWIPMARNTCAASLSSHDYSVKQNGLSVKVTTLFVPPLGTDITPSLPSRTISMSSYISKKASYPIQRLASRPCNKCQSRSRFPPSKEDGAPVYSLNPKQANRSDAETARLTFMTKRAVTSSTSSSEAAGTPRPAPALAVPVRTQLLQLSL